TRLTVNETLQQAFDRQERLDRISNSKLASVLSMILMPAGITLDYFVYHEKGFVPLFFAVRIAASCLVGLVWLWFHLTREKHDRVFGVSWYMIPMVAISWMVYYAHDPDSPYYAGLNIVLLAVGLLSPWTYRQNLISAAVTVVLYLISSYASMGTHQPFSAVFNNVYFITLTAVIVVAGSRASYNQRVREFTLRYELDRNKQELEPSNRRLIELDRLKSRFFANLSHEMRTPLTLLLSPLETLLQRYSFDGDVREQLLTMQNNGMRLLKLINDLLELIRLEAGRMQIKSEPLAVREFIHGLASAVRQMAENKNIQFETRIDSAIQAVLA